MEPTGAAGMTNTQIKLTKAEFLNRRNEMLLLMLGLPALHAGFGHLNTLEGLVLPAPFWQSKNGQTNPWTMHNITHWCDPEQWTHDPSGSLTGGPLGAKWPVLILTLLAINCEAVRNGKITAASIGESKVKPLFSTSTSTQLDKAINNLLAALQLSTECLSKTLEDRHLVDEPQGRPWLQTPELVAPGEVRIECVPEWDDEWTVSNQSLALLLQQFTTDAGEGNGGCATWSCRAAIGLKASCSTWVITSQKTWTRRRQESGGGKQKGSVMGKGKCVAETESSEAELSGAEEEEEEYANRDESNSVDEEGPESESNQLDVSHEHKSKMAVEIPKSTQKDKSKSRMVVKIPRSAQMDVDQ
ncbi:hypothetical protein FRC08_010773 [Ceratobasidium sp. 394]|nr:hypothetical protein FRC08_010773 [Ceratobasidium sp. 394]KAG9076046.1 hypothetical protein FS749_012222 [Ceratobasidium sp. UAMH 11750]